MTTTPEIHSCPGTLAPGFSTYSRACLKRLFLGRKVNHVLPYDSPLSDEKTSILFWASQGRISVSGVQPKFPLVIDKNKLRLAGEGERGTYLLKPAPLTGSRAGQMPANEHLTMQIARQVYGIETAENALIFFRNGEPAYLTRRFDVRPDGARWAQDDFASLSGRAPQTHGPHFKYDGNYLELFELMKKHLPAYQTEAPKLFKLLLFNYLFSNGDAHLKNFSLLETPMGDHGLSPAYDLLNSRIHIQDQDFALEGGLLPKKMVKGRIRRQFNLLAEHAGINALLVEKIFSRLLGSSELVESLVGASYLDGRTKRNYWQSYLTRRNKLIRP